MFMNTSDISQTPIVRRFGVRRARIWGKVFFSIMYLMLAAIAVGWSSAGPALFAAGWRGILAGCFVGSLLIFATSLLTQMRLKFLAEIAVLNLPKEGEDGVTD